MYVHLHIDYNRNLTGLYLRKPQKKSLTETLSIYIKNLVELIDIYMCAIYLATHSVRTCNQFVKIA